METTPTIVLDTSVIVAAMFGSKARIILTAWGKGRVSICFSDAVLKEYHHIIGKIPPLRYKAKQFFTQLKQSKDTIYKANPVSFRITIDDPADKKFIECAVAVEADAIVSLDAHLLDIKEYNAIPIVRPVSFIHHWNIQSLL